MEASAFHQRGCRNKRVVSGPAGNQRFEACGMLRLIFLLLLPHEELGNLRDVTNLNSEMHAAGSSGLYSFLSHEYLMDQADLSEEQTGERLLYSALRLLLLLLASPGDE